MKFRRFLSGLLFGAGCALTFIGLLTVVLPSIDNPQLQLVLDSFTMESPHPIASLINRFMAFSLQQNWRMLYLGALVAAAGAWLLLHFTPSRSTAVPPVSEPASPPASVPSSEEPNPFAVDCYNERLQESPPNARLSFIIHTEPILERNQLDEPEEAPLVNPQPYVSARLAVESRAMEAEVGSLSQSGSRILVRTAFDPTDPVPQVSCKEPEPLSEPKAPEVSSAPHVIRPPLAAPSPRIRSTMGRHSAGSSNLPLPRS